jgi:hypothetical protein
MTRLQLSMFVTAALLCGLALAATFSDGERALGPAPAAQREAPASSSSRPAQPDLAAASSAVEISRPEPGALERPRAATPGEAEDSFAAAMDHAERTVASVLNFGAPPPASHERHRIIDRAVGAYLDVAEHLPAGARKQRYLQMKRALAHLNALDADEHDGRH